MWIIILIIVIVIGVMLFVKFDKDFITAVPRKDGDYAMSFENGKKPVCRLIDKRTINNSEYYVFVPVESLSAIPDDDIIILKAVKKDDNKIVLNFAEKDVDEIIYRDIKTKYATKYNFVE